MRVFKTILLLYFFALIQDIYTLNDKNHLGIYKQQDSTELVEDFLGNVLDPSWTTLNFGMVNYSISNGYLNIVPQQECVWWKEEKGPFVYKLVPDDFTVSSLILTRKASDTTAYPDTAWQFGGIMLRDPASDLAGGTQNYIFIAVGFRGSNLQIECKSTQNDRSYVSAVDWNTGDAELSIKREGSNFTLMARPLGDTTWQEIRTYSRSDLPSTLQAGVIVYSFNYGYGGVDLLVKVDNIKFIGNQVPVELESFTGDCTDNGVLLKWVTATELNNSGFIVEKKTSGSYSEIGYLEGAGTTTEKKIYSFIDDHPITGINLYRLKQIDNNGGINISNEITVDVCPPGDFSLNQNYPNPFNPETVIEFSINEPQLITLSVYDVLGNKVKDLIKEYIPVGNYKYNFNASDLSAGIYVYRLSTKNNTATRKMILLK